VTRGAVLGGVLAVAALLRFALLGHNSIWFDEAYVATVALSPWRAIPAVLRTAEFHPPLYYLLMKAWITNTGLREATLRFPSACFGVLTVFLTYALVRRVSSDAVSLLSAGLVAVSPFAVMADQDARMYALLGALTLASTLLLVDSAERRGAVRWGAYGLVSAAMLYTHYLGFCVLLAHGMWVAWFERRRFRDWLVAAAVAGVLYLPWLPSLWVQVTRSETITWGEATSLLDLSQLMGLFAFGGSLLGMPSFFFRNTSLGPLEQVTLLLPFLLVGWRGIRSCATGPRGLALLGLPLAISIGMAFSASLVKPTFLARWFSFLIPFYAGFLALGIHDLAGRFRYPRPRVIALVAGGLLLYSLPVFTHYYFDPSFRPYQWRQAAAMVRGLARPGDVYVYGDRQSELAFTYYYGPTLGRVLLGPKFDAAEIRRVPEHSSRVWLIVAPPFTEAQTAETLQAFGGAYKIVARSDTGGRVVFPSIYLLETRRPTVAGAGPPTPPRP
jgi:4-amino-4-deoxy-L-arabinose transferase-like glycosyltransferase